MSHQRSYLSESLYEGNPQLDSSLSMLEGLGMTELQSFALLEQVLVREVSTLGINDMFIFCALLTFCINFLVLLVPKEPASAAGQHEATYG